MKTDNNILLPRDYYICEIMPFYLAVNKSKSGKCYGFSIYFKILEGEFTGRKIQDYIIIKYSDGKYANMDNLIKICNALKLKEINTNNLSQLEGRVIKLLIDVKMNEHKHKYNYIERYEC